MFGLEATVFFKPMDQTQFINPEIMRYLRDSEGNIVGGVKRNGCER
jgi:hypothetical protein